VGRRQLRRDGQILFQNLTILGPVEAACGAAKVYQLAPRAMRLQKQQILFVSSNAFDVLGAKSFGFKVCWINRAGVPLDPLGPKPDLMVQNFDELETAVTRP